MPRLALAVVALASIAFVGSAHRAVAAPAPTGRLQRGEAIWQRDCAVCHSSDGSGSARGPDIRTSGTASVDFMVSTGRMPIDEPSDAVRRRPPHYSASDIAALVAYTASIVHGPRSLGHVAIASADVANGASMYQLDCAACHQAAGAGGALAYGTVAPSLTAATPAQIVEAIRVGPGSMPVFPRALLTDRNAADIAAYIHLHLRPGDDRGGISLWHLGPVPEGLVAWVLGLGGILIVCRLLGERERASDPSEH